MLTDNLEDLLNEASNKAALWSTVADALSRLQQMNETVVSAVPEPQVELAVEPPQAPTRPRTVYTDVRVAQDDAGRTGVAFVAWVKHHLPEISLVHAKRCLAQAKLLKKIQVQGRKAEYYPSASAMDLFFVLPYERAPGHPELFLTPEGEAAMSRLYREGKFIKKVQYRG